MVSVKPFSTALLTVVIATSAAADEVRLAVAANFNAPMHRIAAQFEKDSGHKLLISFGSTGKLYGQIANGAPFEALLAADSDTPARLEREGYGVLGTRFTYAIGKLVLWSANPALVDDRGDILKTRSIGHLAIANPKTAPYGAAAITAMSRLGVIGKLRPILVQGESIAQTHQFVASGAAELGFVALSQVQTEGGIGAGSAWLVPDNLYEAIRQDAILLTKGRDKPATTALLAYLRSSKAQLVIRAYGYELP
ncbi:molybdate ABC transporter substrate-binding protein [Accumulibacter sp.]|uniref:molybdate ABC transporter substrate-binding protein n=1 Tax=Accumulibacter sp. TaxID=2053492 RepID=UPI00262C0CBC|nr:molybdate ABC transporter substrate-binding protein [Accumulibacter sp.]